MVIDLDTQGHVALSYNNERGDELRDLLLRHKTIEDVRIEARPNLWIVPNSKSSEELIPHLMNVRQREFVLADLLAEESYDYDWIFLDTPPSANLLHDLALIASNYLIVPTLMDHFSVSGLNDTMNSIRAVVLLRGVTPPDLIGILPTRVDMRTNETRKQLDDLSEQIGDQHILPGIPEDTKVREASAYGQTLWEYAPKTPALIGRVTEGKIQNSQGKLGGYLHLCEILEIMVK